MRFKGSHEKQPNRMQKSSLRKIRTKSLNAIPCLVVTSLATINTVFDIIGQSVVSKFQNYTSWFTYF